MKKTAIFLSILAIAATAASVALAQDAAVYSANTIGVIKYEIPAAGALTCVSLPVDSMNDEGDWTFGNTEFAKQLPVGSTVYFWNGTGWEPATKNALTKNWPTAVLTNKIAQGEGIFIKLPASAEAKEIAVVGELPVDAAVTNRITGNGHLDMTSATFYPVEIAFGDTQLATQLPVGSTVYFWNGTGWEPATKNALTKQWPAAVLTNKLAIGEAIFVKGKNAQDVVETCPYDL